MPSKLSYTTALGALGAWTLLALNGRPPALEAPVHHGSEKISANIYGHASLQHMLNRIMYIMSPVKDCKRVSVSPD